MKEGEEFGQVGVEEDHVGKLEGDVGCCSYGN
jgi:hypothetical protein